MLKLLLKNNIQKQSLKTFIFFIMFLGEVHISGTCFLCTCAFCIVFLSEKVMHDDRCAVVAHTYVCTFVYTRMFLHHFILLYSILWIASSGQFIGRAGFHARGQFLLWIPKVFLKLCICFDAWGLVFLEFLMFSCAFMARKSRNCPRPGLVHFENHWDSLVFCRTWRDSVAFFNLFHGGNPLNSWCFPRFLQNIMFQ